MNKFLPIINTTLAGIMFGAVSFGLAFAVYMKIYIYRFGSFRLEIYFLSDTLDAPVLTAFIVGIFVGLFYGFFIGLLIGIVKPVSILNGIWLSAAIAATFIFMFTSGSLTSNSESSVEFYAKSLNLILFLLLYFCPSTICGLIATKVLRLSQTSN